MREAHSIEPAPGKFGPLPSGKAKIAEVKLAIVEDKRFFCFLEMTEEIAFSKNNFIKFSFRVSIAYRLSESIRRENLEMGPDIGRKTPITIPVGGANVGVIDRLPVTRLCGRI